MKKFGLIGQGLSHSKSPKLHQIIGDKLSRNLTYQLFDLEHISQVKLLIDDLRNSKYDGFNVTIPYKEALIPFLDVITSKAQKIGAINTIYMKDNQVIGDNTDYDGFKYLFENQLKIERPTGIIILGSGGAAKSVYTVCKDFGYQPCVISRKLKHSNRFERVSSYEDVTTINYNLIINTTPIGMYPNIDAIPLDLSLVKDRYVIDLIYNPIETKLMQHAKQSIGGIDMLIIQAVKAQNIWFNKDIVVDTNLLNYIREDLYE